MAGRFNIGTAEGRELAAARVRVSARTIYRWKRKGWLREIIPGWCSEDALLLAAREANEHRGRPLKTYAE